MWGGGSGGEGGFVDDFIRVLREEFEGLGLRLHRAQGLQGSGLLAGPGQSQSSYLKGSMPYGFRASFEAWDGSGMVPQTPNPKPLNQGVWCANLQNQIL